MTDNQNTSQPAESKPVDNSRRQFLKYAAVGAVGVGIASAVELPAWSNQLAGDNQKLNKANATIAQQSSQISTLQTQVASLEAGLSGSNTINILSIDEQIELEAMVETIIPSDSNGPGAKEAGVIYFIDRALSTDYGTNARMYMQPPFVQPGTAGPITVDNISYAAGTQTLPWSAGTKYQYNMTLRDFWKLGLAAVETYSNSILGANFEKLGSSDQVQVLTDLFNNEPTSFNGIVPQDFFQELIFMTWSGFLMDPLYGGNAGMVGWTLTGFTGADMMDAFNEGRDVMKLMVASSPTAYPPHSMGQYQATLGLLTGVGMGSSGSSTTPSTTTPTTTPTPSTGPTSSAGATTSPSGMNMTGGVMKR